MSDFRDRVGDQLTAAAANLATAGSIDFRGRLGLQLEQAAVELAAGRLAPSPPPRRRARQRARHPADFRARYGAVLVRAAARLAGGESAAPARRRVPWLTRPVAVGLAVTAFAGTAFAAVAVWTPILGTTQYGYNPGSSATAPPQDQLDALAVLRRPQTDADRGALSQTALTYINDYTTGVRTAYVRLLGSSGGLAFVLVPVEKRDATASTGGAPSASRPLENALCLYALTTSGPSAINGGCWSLHDVEQARADFSYDGQLVGLAPDSASSVSALLTSGSVEVPVTNNLFDMSLPAGGPPILPQVRFG